MARPSRARPSAPWRYLDRRGRSFDRRSALSLGVEVVHLALERLDILEARVDAGEADVGDLIQRPQLVHRHLADDRRVHFRASGGAQLGFDLIGRLLGGLFRQGSARQSLAESRHQLLAVELLAGAVALDHHQSRRLDPLVSGEPRAARLALAAAPNAGLIQVARIHDASLSLATSRTTHRGPPSIARSAGARIPPGGSPPRNRVVAANSGVPTIRTATAPTTAIPAATTRIHSRKNSNMRPPRPSPRPVGSPGSAGPGLRGAIMTNANGGDARPGRDRHWSFGQVRTGQTGDRRPNTQRAPLAFGMNVSRARVQALQGGSIGCRALLRLAFGMFVWGVACRAVESAQ